MRVVARCVTATAFAEAAADVVADQLRLKPESTLALPTGNTPIALYAELVRRSQLDALDLRRAHVFNLDEYVGLTRGHSRSYAAFIDRHLAAPLGLPADQVRLLRGDAPDLEQECAAYDAAIEACGGIDLCVLGLGVNGHIAFNEPGSKWDLATHVVRLSAETRAMHAAQSGGAWTIPAWGITMGIRTILEARAILLLIAGTGKEAARSALFSQRTDDQFPVTSLATHPNVSIIELCAPGDLR